MRKLSRRQTLASMLAAGAGIATPATRAASGPSSTRVSFLLVNDIYRIEENKDGRGGMARFAAAVKAPFLRASLHTNFHKQAKTAS
jgi:5'-nucleotidase / UDP-sugar diphosphatase